MAKGKIDEGVLNNMLGSWKIHGPPRNPERIDEILNLLSTYWSKNPDLRLGQILENIAGRSGSHTFYMEDSIVIEWLKKDLEKK
jgi:hypothetical protein